MTDRSWSIRRAAAGDGEFLADMLVAAVNWSPGWKRRSRRRVLSDPRTARYIAGWPRDTDLGVIAEADSAPAGAAWVRFFPADAPAYGFVRPDVPELTIGVAAAWRGRGVGRDLLRAIAAAAAAAGIRGISLSVRRPPRRASGGSASAWSGRTSRAASTCPRASRWSTAPARSPTPC